jgi:hypothetical protein
LRLIETYFEDSQVLSGVFVAFRKAIQVLSNDTNPLLDDALLNISPDDFAVSMKKIIVDSADSIFITSLKYVLGRYTDYQEIHTNILIILFQLTTAVPMDILTLAMEKLSLTHFKETFELYRGKLRGSPRLINHLHLSILANFSLVEDHELKKNILKDIKAFYRPGDAYKRRLDDFLIRKKSDIEIHETVTRIAVNLTNSKKLSAALLDTQFYNDIIEVLILIGSDEEPNDVQKLDFIQRIVNKKGLKIEKVKKFVQGIVENTLAVVINLLQSEASEAFTKKVNLQ